MLFGLLALVLALVFVVFGLCYIKVQEWLYPQRLPIQPQATDSPFTEVTFITKDALTIYGWYAPSDSGQVILMLFLLLGELDAGQRYLVFEFLAGQFERLDFVLQPREFFL